MIRSRLIPVLTIWLTLLAAFAVPAAGAVKKHTCFYYASSGWGLWATRNVTCKTAKTVYTDAMKRVQGGVYHRTIGVDGYRCKMHFDGGGAGTCTASRKRRISFDVP